MSTKLFNRLSILALVLSVGAAGLAGFSLYKANKAVVNDADFSAKVEKGINDFIEKQRAAQAGETAPSQPVNASIDDDAIKGSKNAPVTIVEFSDYQCPFCGRFVQTTLPQIVSDYIDKGKVRLVFRDFPLSFHPNAKPAALAAECAKDQGGDEMYYKFHDKIFGNQETLSVDSLKKWAGELGLKTAQFNDCLDTKKFEKEVDKDFADGQSYGVSGTPAFFINGKMISGAQPFSVFKTAIDEALKQ
ncbi:MAG: DsbA family protein [Candidatus Magasanikbacteria bacterium]|nr:DsbA family protein [Candidatus Magasanikbacteria bacterium]